MTKYELFITFIGIRPFLFNTHNYKYVVGGNGIWKYSSSDKDGSYYNHFKKYDRLIMTFYE